MLKLLDTSAFYDPAEPSITLLNLAANDSGLEKKAAHEDIQAFLDTLQPKPGYTYLHINAMTAGEYHGSNRNADFFPEENLKKYYKTFETTPAYVYRSHINKDPKRSYGKVIFAVYNERMHRVELICECPDELVEDISSRIQAGDFPTTSMACRTPYDTCSICGNKAKSRAEYCSHLKTELNRLYADGKKVYAINDGPLTFFDISIVVRPADVNSSILQKVAYDGSAIGSAELAETEGLTEDGFHKRAAFKKLSELIKEISDDCYVTAASKDPKKLLDSTNTSDLPVHLVEKLYPFDLEHTFSAMANLAISPSINFLAELIARKKLGDGYDGIGAMVEAFIMEVPQDNMVPVMNLSEPTETSPIVESILKPYTDGCSLRPASIEKRAGLTNVGYFGNGPHIEPNEEELRQQSLVAQNFMRPNDESNWTKLLLRLGTTALLAKYYITSQIDRRMREKDSGPSKSVKITIVKQASDYLVTSQLAKLAMQSALPRRKEESSGKNSVSAGDISKSVTKRILSNTKSKVGGKLMTLLRAFSIGQKVSNLGS